jgi:hypothetical protein
MAGPHPVILQASMDKDGGVAFSCFDVGEFGAVHGDPLNILRAGGRRKTTYGDSGAQNGSDHFVISFVLGGVLIF